MTAETTSEKPSRSPRRPYAYRPGSDGCDETWDIVSKKTGSVVAAVGFWEVRRRAENKAKFLTSSGNAAELLARIATIRSGRYRDGVYLYAAITEVIDEALKVRVGVLGISGPGDD